MGDWLEYVELVTKFLDSPTSEYSLHKIALEGVQFGKDVGQWFGPGTVSQVLKYNELFIKSFSRE
jgi:cysteine protease ATG4